MTEILQLGVIKHSCPLSAATMLQNVDNILLEAAE